MIASIDSVLSAAKCGDLFTNDPTKAKQEYRELARRYHPDHNGDPRAKIAFQKIGELYRRASDLFGSGDWEVSNQLLLKDTSGKRIRFRYLKEYSFELGSFYISRTKIAYLLNEKKYAQNAVKRINGISYANEGMEREFRRYMPDVFRAADISDGRHMIVLNKTDDVFLLDDIKRFMGAVPEKHVAWIVSRLLNICCFFNHSGLSHNGLSLNNCFISPKFHTVMPLGGWWYAVGQGERMIGTQGRIYNVMPIKAKSKKVGSIVTDLESVRLIAKDLLGDSIKTISVPFRSWIESGSCNSAFDEFERWNKALDDSYGKRKFIELAISESDIYK